MELEHLIPPERDLLAIHEAGPAPTLCLNCGVDTVAATREIDRATILAMLVTINTLRGRVADLERASIRDAQYFPTGDTLEAARKADHGA